MSDRSETFAANLELIEYQLFDSGYEHWYLLRDIGGDSVRVLLNNLRNIHGLRRPNTGMGGSYPEASYCLSCAHCFADTDLVYWAVDRGTILDDLLTGPYQCEDCYRNGRPVDSGDLSAGCMWARPAGVFPAAYGQVICKLGRDHDDDHATGGTDGFGVNVTWPQYEPVST